MSRETILKKVGQYCRNFRIEVLTATLEQVANGTNIKTLSGFEHGRSNNLLHVLKYLECCTDNVTRNLFLNGLCEVLEGVNNE